MLLMDSDSVIERAQVLNDRSSPSTVIPVTKLSDWSAQSPAIGPQHT